MLTPTLCVANWDIPPGKQLQEPDGATARNRTTYQGGYCPIFRYAGVKCNPGVRFTRNGSPTTSPNGYLQVYDSSTKRWGPVCGGSAWGNRQRTDACQQAGFGPTYPVKGTLLKGMVASAYQTSAYCVSSTKKNTDCNQGVQWGASTCTKSTDNLYISCQKPIRLVGRNQYEGRVEVFNGGVWGTVCDTTWDDNDAQVVCKQLGYNYGGTAYGSARYGRGRGPVWLDTVNCYGSENAITDCKHTPLARESSYRVIRHPEPTIARSSQR
ncbi:neurotrypsin-like [Corticium candelabrum]|uniref:neurotrypsin-like n=1 Tax=Corticium candelabrum TaxID=121492 RepID=UPI002E25995F|nr:neurotrypsin-like [Corticium candelabrum]